MPWCKSTDIDQGISEKYKVAWNEKRKKQLWFFVYIRYGKFWSVPLELFIKIKPLFSEVWIVGLNPKKDAKGQIALFFQI